MKLSKIGIVIAFGVAFSIQPTAEAAGVFRDIAHLSGNAVHTHFNYIEAGIFTFVTVTTTDYAVVNPSQRGGPDDQPFTAIDIVRIDGTTGQLLMAATGFTEDFTLTVDRDLASARLQLETVMFDEAQFESFPLALDISWVATSELERSTTTSHVNETGFVFNAYFEGEHRDAEASGTVFAKGDEFIPFPSNFAEIQNNNNGGIMIQLN